MLDYPEWRRESTGRFLVVGVHTSRLLISHIFRLVAACLDMSTSIFRAQHQFMFRGMKEVRETFRSRVTW
jgi:hypothetical protein